MKIRQWKNKLIINGEFQQLRRLALELPGYKKFLNDALLLEPSGKNIEVLVQKGSEVEWQQSAIEHLEQYNRRESNELKLNSQKYSELQEDDYEYKTKPFEHQKRAFLISRDQHYYAYFMEMGTGKTKVVIDNAAYLCQKGKIDCLLIFAPNGVHAQWINEQLRLHMPIPYSGYIYRASTKQSIKAIESIENDERDLKVIAFNVDALSNKKSYALIEKTLRKFRSMMVIDESVRIKSMTALRTKNAIKLSELAPYRRIMSGAPVTKGCEDLYSQFKLLHPDILGFSSFYTFRNYYCIMGGFESRQIVGYKPNAIKELEQRIETYAFRITKQECLDLPEKVYIKRYVDLTPEQDELYTKIEDELAIDLRYVAEIKQRNAGASVGDIPFDDIKKHETALMAAITKMLRMQQIICGHFVYEDENGTKHSTELPSNRISALMDIIEESQSKVIVWSRFVDDIKRISSELKKAKIGHVLYYGDITSKQREENIEQFKNREEMKVFLAQPASGGTGLNLAVASTTIYFSNDFNADTRWQSEDRIHRIGQKNVATYIDLITPKTIDDQILDSLSNKKNVADSLLDNPRKFIRS